MTNKATHKKARSCPALFIVVVALAALGATASIVAAQATPGTQFRVNSGIADWQSNPAVAMDPTGRFVIAWSTLPADLPPDPVGCLPGINCPGHAHVFAQRFDATGVREGVEFQVDPPYYFEQFAPAVAMDAAGNFVIVWSGSRFDGLGIYARRFDSLGNPRGDAFPVFAIPVLPGDPGIPQRFPIVGMAANGDFTVVWEGTATSTYALCSGLCAKRFDANGNAVGDLFQINTVPAMSRYDISSPPTKSMAMSAAGDFAVVWEYAPPYGDGPAYGRHFQADGTPTGSADYPLTSATAYSPMVAINGSGLVTVWTESGGGMVGEMARRRDLDFSPLGPAFSANTNTTPWSARSAIGMDNAGNFVVVWVGYNPVTDGTSIYKRQFNAGGSALEGESLVTIAHDEPAVAMDGSGNFIVAFTDYDGDRTGISARLYTGSPLPPPPVTNTIVGSNVAVQPLDPSTMGRPVTVTFSAVTQEGNTTVVTSTTGPPPPTGFALGAPPTYYELSTTATFTPPINVCINYTGIVFPPSGFYGAAVPRLLHYETHPSPQPTGWYDRTQTVDAVNHIICGHVDHFSVFGLFADVTPPVLALPADLVLEATSGVGTVAIFSATAADDVDGARPMSCMPPAGSAFQLGVTPVTCSASDTSGNTATGSFTITVRDSTPPGLQLPGNLTLAATGPAGAMATFTVSAADLVDGPTPVSCAPASGGTFALGVTTVTCSSVDSHGNVATGSFTVRVGYQICLLYDAPVMKKSGSTYPIKLRLCDSSGRNLSSSSIVLHATSVLRAVTNTAGLLDDSGNANPDFDFRYDASLAGYIFNLSTKGIAPGTYNLNFIAGADPVPHSAQFGVR